jgi:BlaI family penicillinase repressor
LLAKSQYFGLMAKTSEPGVFPDLSRRENQIMEAIYARGEATATDVLDTIPNAPTRTAVRTMLTILVKKGLLKHRREGREYVYMPTRKKTQAAKSVLSRVLDTFFDGSLEKAVASHLDGSAKQPSDDELAEIEKLIREAREHSAR